MLSKGQGYITQATQMPSKVRCVEGWHSRLKKVVGMPHPNIFELIEVIKKEEATTRMKMSLYESGAKEPPRRRKVREREKNPDSLSEVQWRKHQC